MSIIHIIASNSITNSITRRIVTPITRFYKHFHALQKSASGVVNLTLPSIQQNVDSAQITKKLLPTHLPIYNAVCGFKVKGRLKRRCKDCYFVMRQERLYVICKTHPRHKQMSMKAQEKKSWILTHATQGPVRAW